MKRFALLLSMLCALAMAWPAAAQRGDRYSRDNNQQRDAQQHRDGRDGGSRYARQEDYRNRDDRQREQLSRDQREQLRRDISDHGREIYRDRGSDRDRR